MWNAYNISPIDIGWHNLPTVQEVALKFAEEDVMAKLSATTSENDSADFFLRNFEIAKSCASSLNWDGDFRSEPRVLWLPSEAEGCFLYGFVWKQNHNGDTFIISPIKLPWLEK